MRNHKIAPRLRGSILCNVALLVFVHMVAPTAHAQNRVAVSGIEIYESDGVYVTGNFVGVVDFDPGDGSFILSSAEEDIFIAKFDADGNFIWAKAIGSGGDEESFGIAVDDAGNVYAAGRFEGVVDFDPGPGSFRLNSRGFTDSFVVKLDPSGEFVWAKSLGSERHNTATGISLDDSGNVYVVGDFRGAVDFDPGPGSFELTSEGNTDVFSVKLDSNGDFLWAKIIGGPNLDEGRGIASGTSGDVYLTGFLGPLEFNDNIFVSKLDTRGDSVWTQSVGSEFSSGRGADLAVDASMNVHTTGTFEGIVDFDPGPANLELNGLQDVFILKLDVDGGLVWAKSVGGPSLDTGSGVAVDDSGSVFVCGRFNAGADFDPGEEIFDLNNAGEEDAFVVKLDAVGDFVWAKAVGGSSQDRATDIALDDAGNVYTVGRFSARANFDPGPGSLELTGLGESDSFVLKLNADGGLVWAKAITGTGDTSGSVGGCASQGLIGSSNSNGDLLTLCAVITFSFILARHRHVSCHRSRNTPRSHGGRASRPYRHEHNRHRPRS